MPIPDDERSINEPHAATFYPRTPQADGSGQIADATVIYFDNFDNFDAVYIFDIFDIFDIDDIDDIEDVCRIDDINAVEQAESAYQDARG